MSDGSGIRETLGNLQPAKIVSSAGRHVIAAARWLWEFIFPSELDRRLQELTELSRSGALAAAERRLAIRDALHEGELLKQERTSHPNRHLDAVIARWLADTDYLVNDARRWALFLTLAFLGCAFIALTVLAELLRLFGLDTSSLSLAGVADWVASVFTLTGTPEHATLARTVQTTLMLGFSAAAIGTVAILFFGPPRRRWTYVAAMAAAAGPIAVVAAVGFHIAHQANHVRGQETRYALAAERAREASQRLEQADAHVAELTARTNEVGAEIVSLDKLITALRQPGTKFQEAQDAAKQRMAQLNRQLAFKEEDEAELEARIAAETAKLPPLQQRVTEVEALESRARAERDAHMNGQDTAEYRRLDLAWRKLAGAKRDATAKMAAAETASRTLRESLRTLRRDIATLRNEVDTLETIAQDTGTDWKGADTSNLLARKAAKAAEKTRLQAQLSGDLAAAQIAATEFNAKENAKAQAEVDLETARINYVNSWGMDADMAATAPRGSDTPTPVDKPADQLQSGYARFLKVVADFVGANEFRMYFAVVFLVLSFPWLVGMVLALPKQAKIGGALLLLYAAL